MSKILSSIRIVLLQTYHPGNIGAVARAMKTMGLNELYLVNPREFPASEATSRAAGAVDVLEQATVVSSLQEAISDRTQVFATSARRQRSYSRPQLSSEQTAQWIKQHPEEKVAIVFGRERMGLSNEDINLCQQLLYIPGNPDYDVLNLAAATQIVCYELFKQLNEFEFSSKVDTEFASQENVNRFYAHLNDTLESTGYLQKEHPGESMQRLRQFFSRAQPTEKEIRMLRGVLSSVDRQLPEKK